ncbi:ATP-binding cassette domain-containing protein [Nocardia tenerifensis]|uniref:ATP-binding cassette domain-containing protein n=1 Tax=Nocardia tenerifensis TaxID=228006 RepID=UPI000316D3D6|nr:ATP-binding cassette domain-containing protein [Nocardia tenerifensis]
MQLTGLRATGLSKSFAGVPALRDVSLDFPAGAVTALMGENGAGKSTLIRILGGDHRPDSGRLELDGVALAPATPADARAAGIRVIGQEPEIVPHVSVAENVYLGALPRRAGRLLDRAALRERMRTDLARLGFDRDLDPDTLGSKLTAAQRQLVEIMRALTTDAKVIAFDEPTSSLSDHETESLFALIGRLRARGLAVIYVSHRMREIFQLADRVAVAARRRAGRRADDRGDQRSGDRPHDGRARPVHAVQPGAEHAGPGCPRGRRGHHRRRAGGEPAGAGGRGGRAGRVGRRGPVRTGGRARR